MDKVYCRNCKHYLGNPYVWHGEECLASVSRVEDTFERQITHHEKCFRVNRKNNCPKYELRIN